MSPADVRQPRSLPRVGAALPVRRRWAGYAVAVLVLPTMTGVLAEVGRGLSLGSVLLLYLAAVVAVAVVGGFGPALVAVGGAFLTANWFFTPPYHTLVVEGRDAVVELIAFALVAGVVALAVELSARQRALAARSEFEAGVLARLATRPVAELSVQAALEQVRRTFGMSAAALVRPGGSGVAGSAGPDGAEVPDRVLAHVGTVPGGPPSIRLAAGPELELVTYGPRLFAEDRGLLERLATAAARALEAEGLTEAAAQAGQLAAVDRARSALLAAVGHDLRTPLAAVKAAVSSLRQDDVEWSPQEHAELLATIEDSADRLGALITNLLDMSRLQAGALTVQLAAVAVDEVVPRALLGVPSEDVVVDIPDGLPLVRTDAGLLERVVANLVGNARRFAPAGRPVRVVARAGEGERARQVELRVVDHGPGVPEPARTTMFEPFQRLDDRGGDGVGLGLAIVRGFAEALGVAVVPSTTPGGGLTMSVTLPVAEPVADADPAAGRGPDARPVAG